jgi:hypothetical protein
LADSLAKRYITYLETSQGAQIFTVMDFFNTSANEASGRALNALIKAPSIAAVHLNYQTWSDY